MHASIHAANPFVMLTDPASLLQEIEKSERLKGLQGRICRPLDRPALVRHVTEDVARFDALVEDSQVDPEVD